MAITRFQASFSLDGRGIALPAMRSRAVCNSWVSDVWLILLILNEHRAPLIQLRLSLSYASASLRILLPQGEKEGLQAS